MSRRFGIIRSLCVAVILAASVLTTGCFFHRSRVYDSYYNDYHPWNDREIDAYHRWATETHRDPNREYRSLSKDEQEEYWQWRHNHEDQKKKHRADQQQ